MDLKSLKRQRLLGPGIIFVLFSLLINYYFNFIDVKIDLKNSVFFVLFYCIGTLYILTPLRNISNKCYHERINENIRSRIVKISGELDDKERYNWHDVKRIFYHFIDTNKSLTEQAFSVRFNGLIWTTLADFRVLSVFFLIISYILLLVNMEAALKCYVTFLFFFLISYPLSEMSTRRHIELGEEQLSIIEDFHKDELRKIFRKKFQ